MAEKFLVKRVYPKKTRSTHTSTIVAADDERAMEILRAQDQYAAENYGCPMPESYDLEPFEGDFEEAVKEIA